MHVPTLQPCMTWNLDLLIDTLDCLLLYLNIGDADGHAGVFRPELSEGANDRFC